MGIKGFLRETKVENKRNIKHYKNKKVAVDAYSWLHKALYNCGEQVLMDNDISGIYKYFATKIGYMQILGIKVVLVFDGDDLNLKSGTNENREENRKKAREKIEAEKRAGNEYELKRLYGSAIDVTPEMAHVLKTRLQNDFPTGLEFIVAPYEADSQMAYLSRIGYVDVVISEDSDLLIFGAKKVFYKMDNDFNGDEVELSGLENSKKYSFKGWSHDEIISFAILCGCDYLESPKGMGFASTHKIFSKTKTIEGFMQEMRGRLEDDFYDKFICAYLSFKYQNVWCPIVKKMTILQPFQEHDKEYKERALSYYKNYSFLGGYIEPEVVRSLVNFEIDPVTKKEFPKEAKYIIRAKMTKEVPKRIMPRVDHEICRRSGKRIRSKTPHKSPKSARFKPIVIGGDFLGKDAPQTSFFAHKNSLELNIHFSSEKKVDFWKMFAQNTKPKKTAEFEGLGFADEPQIANRVDENQQLPPNPKLLDKSVPVEPVPAKNIFKSFRTNTEGPR